MLTLPEKNKIRRDAARFGVFPIIDQCVRLTMTEAKINLTTGEFECGFVNLASPNKFGNYGVEMILPDSSAELKAITTAITKAGKDAGVEDGHSPVKQATEWDGENSNPRSGYLSITAKTNEKSLGSFFKALDVGNEEIDLTTIRKGDTARAKICVKPYDTGSNRGVTVYLNAIQKLSSGYDDSFGPLPDKPEAQQEEDLLF